MLFRAVAFAAVASAALLPQSNVDPLHTALALFNSGKYQECFELVTRYAQQNAQSGAAYKLLGMSEYMLGQPREALGHLQRATQLAPKDPDAFYYLGRLYFSADNAVAALDAYRQALQLDPASVRAQNHIGQAYEAMGRLRDAEQAYLKAIEMQQDRPKKSEWPYYNLGLLYLNGGRSEQSIAWFRQALACNPEFPEAKMKLAAVLAEKQSSDEALKLLEETVLAEPQNAEAHYRLAKLLAKSGKREEAQKHFALFEKYRKP
jgi:tetratricopeptide (TPR) repeat protein